ncbi:MAG: MazG family protein [Chloroflexi bacterium]|nr:MazG family protein [Chloroflexota bacterium]
MSITILGLGPGNPEHLTREAWALWEGATEVYLRTERHPTVAGLPAHLQVHSFDRLYEEMETFEAVYAAITERVLALGQRPQGVLYAVPGHPWVGEATTARIVAQAQVGGQAVRVVEGLSFLEPAWTALGLDPLSGLQLVDALDLARQHHPQVVLEQPVLVGQLYSRWLASEVKLTLMACYPDDHPVMLVQALSTPTAQVRSLPLYELDRQADLDHLSSLLVPPLGRPGSLLALQEVVAHLRAPEGCPWDREQTHRSLRPEMMEELYEALQALDEGDEEKLREELGDLLLEACLQMQIAADEGEFLPPEVVSGVVEKLVRRHPHVFGGEEVSGPGQVLRNWEESKRLERGDRGYADMLNGVPTALPALAQCQAYQKRVARVGPSVPLEGALALWLQGLVSAGPTDGPGQREAWLGQALFGLAGLAQRWGVDAESVLREANRAFAHEFHQAADAVERGEAQWSGVTWHGLLPDQQAWADREA